MEAIKPLNLSSTSIQQREKWSRFAKERNFSPYKRFKERSGIHGKNARKQGVVQLEAAYFNKDKAYLVMEYCDSGDLYKALKNNSLTFKEKLIVAKEILLGLSHIHDNGIVHRDLKPQNVFLYTKPDGSIGAKIADFGLACDIMDREDRRYFVGTNGYISPERCLAMKYKDRDQSAFYTTHKSDVWAMGCVLFNLFTQNNSCLDYMMVSSNSHTAWSKNAFTLAGADLVQSQIDDNIAFSGIRSTQIKVLLNRILQVNPAQRVSARWAYDEIANILLNYS